MQHGPSLLATIVVSLALAYAGGMLARLARLPPIVGYLLAGIAVGPFTPGFMADQQLRARPEVSARGPTTRSLDQQGDRAPNRFTCFLTGPKHDKPKRIRVG